MAFLRVAVALLCLVLIESASSAVPKLNSVKRHPFADIDLGGRIINGTLAEAKATKHQISLRRRLNDGYFFGTGHICGAVLIRYNVALSAGHCIVDQWIYDGTFVDKESLILVMGNLDRFERNENTLIFDIKEMVLPLEKFNLATYDKDIALLFLDGSVPKDHPTVAPIALVESEMEPGTVCQVTGWGRTEDGYATDFLMTVDLPIISHEVCVTETDFDEELIGEGMICAGYLEGERDACAGDSGGPMVCNQKLGAIVSWGSGCALPRRPGVYTSIDFWRDWIEFEIAAYEATENGSGTEEPGTEEPGTEEPGTEEPGTEEPGTEEPGTEEPITEEPGSGEGSGDGDGDAAFSIRSSVTLISGCFLLVTTLFHKLM